MPPRCICFMFCQSPFSGLIGILVQAQAPILWGFLDAWTKFLSTVRDWIGSVVGTLIFKVNVSPNMHFGLTPTCIEKMGGRTQEVTVARYGPILWENGATGSRKVSRYLMGLWDGLKHIKTHTHTHTHTPGKHPKRIIKSLCI